MNSKDPIKPQTIPTPHQGGFGTQPVHEKSTPSTQGQKQNSNGNKK